MKVFVINLDRDVDRMSIFSGQMKRLGVDYDRISAIYAKGLPENEKGHAVNKFRWWCAVGRRIREGEIGCQLSHQIVYKKMVDEHMPLACILEDDVSLDKRFPYVLAELEKKIIHERPIVVLLSNHVEPTAYGSHEAGYLSFDSEFSDPVSMKRIKTDMFSEGYVINNAAAKELLHQNYPIIVPTDAWGRWARIGAIDLYRSQPTVCCQNKEIFSSNTTPGLGVVVHDLNPFRCFLWKLKRIVGVCLDNVMILLNGK